MDRACERCGKSLAGRRKGTRFCTATCRAYAHVERQRSGQVVELRPPAVEVSDPPEAESGPVVGPVEALTARDLETAGKLDTPVGAICLALARRIDNSSGDTASALQAAAGRLDDMLSKATRGLVGKTAPDLLEDELAARRNGRGA